MMFFIPTQWRCGNTSIDVIEINTSLHSVYKNAPNIVNYIRYRQSTRKYEIALSMLTKMSMKCS